MKLSIVTTANGSENLISEFYERMSKAAQQLTTDYEIIFLNDGSQDKSLDLILQLYHAPIPPNLMTVRLMTHRFVANLIQFRDQVFVISILWGLTGFKRIGGPLVYPYKGKSAYSVATKLRYFVQTITTTGDKPLVYVVRLGAFITAVVALVVFYILMRYFFSAVGVDGRTSLMVSIWLLGGLIMLALGVVGAYVSVIFTEVKVRPYTIVRHVYQPSVPIEEEVYAKNTM